MNDMLTWAMGYLAHNFSVIPLAGKICSIEWKQYQERRADGLTVGNWERTGKLQNIGVVCGAVSNNLVVIDCDGEAAWRLWEKAFPELTRTYTVFTGSGVGKHYYYRVANLPPTTRAMKIDKAAGGNIELRANGCYVVAPPSRHPDTGWSYSAKDRHGILLLQNMDEVKEWLYSFIAQKTEKPVTAGKPPAERHSKPADRRTMSYARAARAALGYETWNVQKASEGGRNNALSRAAYNLGQLVGDSLLTRSEVESALLGAARAAGLPENEAQRTISAQIEVGIAEPRSRQWQKR